MGINSAMACMTLIICVGEFSSFVAGSLIGSQVLTFYIILDSDNKLFAFLFDILCSNIFVVCLFV